MKNLLFAFTALAMIFAACSKDEDDSSTGTLNGGNNSNNTEENKGCTDPLALNYDSTASESDGSCTYITPSETTKRNAIIEEVTGVRCAACPAGKRELRSIKDENPNSFFVIAVHAGDNLGEPIGDDPDLRTKYSSNYLGYVQSMTVSFPSAFVNRVKFSSEAERILRPSKWGGKTGKVINQTSPLNVGVKNEWDNENRELKVTAEIYYTKAQTDNHKLSIALVEDGIMTNQKGTNKDKFEQNDVLRHFLTNQWGDEIESQKKGARIQKEYTYQVPENIKIENAEVVAFVAEGKSEIYTGTKEEVIGE